MNFIGTFGRARHGKDTCANIVVGLLELKGYKAYRYALAGPLKETINLMFGWGDEEAYGDNKETKLDVSFSLEDIWMGIDELTERSGRYIDEYDWIDILKKNNLIVEKGMDKFSGKFSPRQAYQLFGTEMIRDKIGKTFWLDLAEKHQRENEGIMVISDIRFENELEFFLNRDSYCFGVYRPNFDNGIGESHSSEKDIDKLFTKVEHSIINSGTKEELREKVANLVDKHLLEIQ